MLSLESFRSFKEAKYSFGSILNTVMDGVFYFAIYIYEYGIYP